MIEQLEEADHLTTQQFNKLLKLARQAIDYDEKMVFPKLETLNGCREFIFRQKRELLQRFIDLDRGIKVRSLKKFEINFQVDRGLNKIKPLTHCDHRQLLFPGHASHAPDPSLH